jgi:hypothetical protein
MIYRGCLKRAPFFYILDYVFIWLRRACHAEAFLGSFASPKEPGRKNTVYKSKLATASSPKANEPKKRSPEKTTPPFLSPPRCTSHIGATKQGVVRAFSGLPSRILKD